MPSPLRHILSILALPVVMIAFVPYVILHSGMDRSLTVLPSPLQEAAGTVLIVAGLFLFQWTIRLFDKRGKGTLAPWDATTQLVVHGPYRHMRNPMITGVLMILAGESLVFASAGILSWAGIFFLINTVYFTVSEEPGLEKRFGESYRVYKKNVPRWFPRLTPWRPES